MGSTGYVRYDDSGVEPTVPEEKELTSEIISLINATQQKNFSMHRHFMRGTHVKTQAILKGTLTIEPDLPEELAHGIASAQNAKKPHPIAMRFANEPSWLLDDRAPGPRGCSMKIFNINGTFMDPAGESTKTQDLTFNNAPIIELRDVKTATEIFRIRNAHFDKPLEMPEILKKERTDDKDLQLAPYELPNHFFLAYTMYSQAAYRWGPYIVKYALFPTGKTQSFLNDDEDRKISDASDPDQHSAWIREFFAQYDATYDLRVQLCEDLSQQPVEDAAQQWDEEKYPYRTVGKVILHMGQNQKPMDPLRRQAWDDGMHLNVWYGLEDHRPLGSVNRLRKELYKASLAKREQGNARKTKYIDSIHEIP